MYVRHTASRSVLISGSACGDCKSRVSTRWSKIFNQYLRQFPRFDSAQLTHPEMAQLMLMHRFETDWYYTDIGWINVWHLKPYTPGATHKATKTVYICTRFTQKKYATTRSIAHITIYNKRQHNHHYSHVLRHLPKLISATGSYWNGRIPVAISNFSGKFSRSFVHWNCRSNNANGSRVLSWRHD